MKHLTTSQICVALPDEIWDLILAKTDPYACLVFGRDDIIPKIESLDVRKWLCRAIVIGHLGVVRGLSHQNGPWLGPENAMFLAAMQGHLHIVKWLHENRKEDCTVKAIDWAAKNGHLEVVKWLHHNRREGCTEDAMDWAAEYGHLEVVQWLHENRTEGCTEYAMDLAAEHGHLHIVKWLHENRTEGCTPDAMDWAAGNGHLEVVRWLRQILKTERINGKTK